MVRTLVFRTNSVGSIPTGLKMLTELPILHRERAASALEQNQITVYYTMRFSSLVPPNVRSNTLSNWQSKSQNFFNSWRVTFKKSYYLLYWFKYLSLATKHVTSKRKSSLAILPRSRSIYTLTKAPMAHKTNSKEQFMFNFYHFVFTLTIETPLAQQPSTLEQSAYTALLSKQLFPVFETNLLSLNSYLIVYASRDSNYLKLPYTPR